jgi:hypothetical protein
MSFRSSANGIAKKGKTAGKMVTMAKGGKMAAGGKMKKYAPGGAVAAPPAPPVSPAVTAVKPAASMASKRPMHAHPPRPMAPRRMAKGGKMKGC